MSDLSGMDDPYPTQKVIELCEYCKGLKSSHNRHESCYQARIQELEGLVREMGSIIRLLLTDDDIDLISHMSPSCGDDFYFCSACGKEAITKDAIEHLPACPYKLANGILNRPEVKEIMEKTP